MDLEVKKNRYDRYEVKIEFDQIKYESEWLNQDEMDELAINVISQLLYYRSEKVLTFLKSEYFEEINDV